jgi:signal transduction histidine kinase
VNLLSNAIKYGGGPGSTVNIDLQQCTVREALSAALSAGTSDLKLCNGEKINVVENGGESVVLISIRDHGHGISEEEMGNLFGKYVQLEKQNHPRASKFSKTQPMSTGLGLHLVLNFIRSMDGHIFVRNSESGGSIFSFWFPQAQFENKTIAITKNDTAQELTVSHCKLSKEVAALHRVVVVDDSGTFRLTNCGMNSLSKINIPLGFFQ